MFTNKVRDTNLIKIRFEKKLFLQPSWLEWGSGEDALVSINIGGVKNLAPQKTTLSILPPYFTKYPTLVVLF